MNYTGYRVTSRELWSRPGGWRWAASFAADSNSVVHDAAAESIRALVPSGRQMAAVRLAAGGTGAGTAADPGPAG
jgi:hypothetical protein